MPLPAALREVSGDAMLSLRHAVLCYGLW